MLVKEPRNEACKFMNSNKLVAKETERNKKFVKHFFY